MSTPAERWRRDLEARAIPSELLAAAAGSPYTWPVHLWHRMQEHDPGDTPTAVVVADLLAGDGTLLDVGSGTGRLSLPPAIRGHRVTAVESSPEMAEGLRHQAARAGVEITVVEGSWPEAAATVGRHDVVLCANVVYNVPDLVPFLTALDAAARVGVVIEAGARHPWARLSPYFRALHGLDRPGGPTGDVLVEIVAGVIGRAPEVIRWEHEIGMRFADLQELLDFYGRRLVVPVERRAELADLLAPDVQEEDGWLTLGGGDRRDVTVWWQAG